MHNLDLTNKAVRRALAFARAAERGDEAARAKAAALLASHCTKHGLSVADIVAAAPQADPTPAEATKRAKRADAGGDEATMREAMRRTAEATKQKPERNSAKPAPKPAAPKPSNPADKAKQREAEARVKLIGELRTSVATLYNGPSLAVRSNPKRLAISVYTELLAAPKHRTTLDRVSVRDESALALIIKRGDKTGGFDPVSLNIDAGIFSRLASVGFIAKAGDGFTLTGGGLSHARKAVNAAKRAKAA